MEKKVGHVILAVMSLLDCGAQVGSVYLIDNALTTLDVVRCIEDDAIIKSCRIFAGEIRWRKTVDKYSKQI